MCNEEIISKINQEEDEDTRRELMAQLYTQNIRLIQKVIAPYIRAGLEADDAQQEGYLALCKAVARYTPTEGAFSTYFVYWIRATVGRYFTDTGHTKRLPKGLQNLLYRYKKALTDFQAKTGEDPTDGYIQRKLGITEAQLARLRCAYSEGRPLSLTQPISADGDTTIGDIVPDSNDAITDTLTAISDAQDAATLWAEVDSLDAQQADVIRTRYQDGRTIRATAQHLDITPSKAQQAEAKALQKLRRRPELQRMAIEHGYKSSELYGGGLGYFKNYGASMVEYAALKHLGEWDRDTTPGG